MLGIAGIVFAPQMLRWMNTPEELIAESVLYVRVYFSGLIFIFIYNMGAAILRAVGDSKRPLYYLIVCSVVNIILDLLLILVIPLGVLGAAIATLIAQAVSAVLVTVTLMYRTEGMKLCLSQIRMYKRMLQSILKIGLPAGFEAIMYSISNIIVQVSINNFGVDTMAAWTAYSKIDFIFWMINSAFGISVMTFVGQNYGAGKWDRIRRGTKICLGMALISAVSVSIILMSAERFLFGIFVNDAGVVEIGIRMMNVIAPAYLLFAFIEVFSGALRAQGAVVVSTLITMVGICVLRMIWVTLVSSRNLRAGHHLLSDHMGGRCACDEHLLHLQAEKNISGKIATKIREYIRETYLLFILIMNRFLFSFIAKLIKCKLNCEKSTKA